MSLRDRLVDAMQRHGMTQVDAAKAGGVTKSAISHIVHGRSADISATAAIRLSRALGVRAEWLVMGSGKEKDEQMLSNESFEMAELYELLSPSERQELQQAARLILEKRIASPIESLKRMATAREVPHD